MNVSLQYLQKCAAETGHRVDPLEKVVRLGELAADIARHPFLGESLVLKGGTALNLCFGPPKRLSVDLDYNYIRQLDREAMRADRPRVEEVVEELAHKHGYMVQRSSNSFASRTLFLSYKSRSGSDDRIEVDLNFLYRLPLRDVAQAELWQPGDLDKPSIRIVSETELCVGKLLALLDRSAARDAWDTAHLPEKFPQILPSSEFRTWFIALSATLIHPLHTYTRARLEQQFTQQAIPEQLAPMLSSPTPPSAAELITSAWAVLEPLMQLQPQEKEYITRIHDGEFQPELLCACSSALVSQLKYHPAIQWKLKSVREHHSSTADKRSG